MDTVYKLGAALSLTDLISGPFKKISGNADKLKSKLKEVDGGIQKFEKNMGLFKKGGYFTAAGTGAALMLKGFVDANRETSQLKSNLKSLGLEGKAISTIHSSALEAGGGIGVARNIFIDAAYDIKSGIETINNLEIGKFTGTVAKTAVATKGDTKQMASLFGTVYNQNKKLYQGLSDSNFGKLIGNSISYAVQMYKTEGSKMQQAIESTSGAAASAGYDFAEQVNVLGMLQNVMPAGEAGTGFKAFTSNVYKAGEKLGMSFVDQKGKILPVVTILEKLKGRYGDTLSLVEKAEMKKAFGSEEALKLVDNLWDKTGKLKSNIEGLRNAKGTEFLDKMAAANIDNIDVSLKGLGNTWDNFKSILGGGIGESIRPFVDILKSGLGWINKFADSHPTLIKWVGGLLALGTVASITAGGFMMLKGMSGLYALSQLAAAGATNTTTIAMQKQSVWSKIAAAKQWLFNTALWGFPLVWIVGGIIALGAAIYGIVKYWDDIKMAASSAWAMITNIWGNASEWLSQLWGSIVERTKGMFSGVANWVKNAGSYIIQTLWEGIESKWEWLKNNVKSGFGFIARLFPHSDAKEGPFSNLTSSGKSLISTFNTGIEQESKKGTAVLPYFQKTSDEMTNASKTPSVSKYMSNPSLSNLNNQGTENSVIGKKEPGFILHIANLIGQLNLNGESLTDNIENLSQRIAEAIMSEVERYGHA